MPAPLLLLDGASMWFRSYFALPSSITAPDGRPVNADALSLILVAKQRTGAPLDRWRGDEVSRLVRIDLVELAEELDVALPADTAVTLWTALDAWADLAVLAPGSDSIAQLREPLCAMAGLDAHGRPRGARVW